MNLKLLAKASRQMLNRNASKILAALPSVQASWL